MSASLSAFYHVKRMGACSMVAAMRYGSAAVKSIDVFRSPANDHNMAAAFVNGFTDGQAARAKSAPLTAYLRVGIDDYAKGFRAGFFTRGGAAASSERSIPLQIVNL
jgi:hypothetical protein